MLKFRENVEGDNHVTTVLKNAVREAIGPIATPDIIVYCDLPKVTVVTSCSS